MNSLPIELIQKTLCYCDQLSIYQFALTNHRYYLIAMPLVYAHVTLYDDSDMMCAFQHSVSNGSFGQNVKTLDIQGHIDPVSLEQIAAGCPGLEQLDIVRFSPIQAASMCRLIQNSFQLKRLSCRLTFVESSLPDISQTHLQSLTLSGTSDAYLPFLNCVLRSSPDLKVFNLRTHAAAMSQIIPILPTGLQVLKFRGTFSALDLAQLSRRCRHLKTLDLSFCNMTDETEAFEMYFPHLTSLDLQCTYLRMPHLLFIFKYFQYVPQILISELFFEIFTTSDEMPHGLQIVKNSGRYNVM